MASLTSNNLEFYDAAHALVGFERSLALVTHYVLNGEIITQAPALKGARIYTEAPSDGSWKSVAKVAIGGALALGSVGKDSPVGYAVTSMFDLAMNASMGFHPDYDKTFQQQLAEQRSVGNITKPKVTSLIEKCESSFIDMHRPLVSSKSAKVAYVYGAPVSGSKSIKLGPDLTLHTYEYLIDENKSHDDKDYSGKVSSYNINTFKGRMFVIEEGRTVSFELTDRAKTSKQTNRIARSLRRNNADKKDAASIIGFRAYRVETRNGRLKHLNITKVEEYISDL